MADQIIKTRLRVPSLGIGPIEERTARIALTAAQIKTLHSVPVSLVPAPGAGRVIIFEELLFDFKYNTVQYTGGGVVQPVYHGHTTGLSVGTVAAATVQAAANALVHLAQQASATGLTVLDNTGLDLYAATADFAAGDGTAIVIVNYAIWSRG